MFQCHSPKSSHPRLSHRVQRLFNTSVSLLLSRMQSYHSHLSKFYIYMRCYTVLVLLFLVYFTLYNRLQFHPWQSVFNGNPSSLLPLRKTLQDQKLDLIQFPFKFLLLYLVWESVKFCTHPLRPDRVCFLKPSSFPICKLA